MAVHPDPGTALDQTIAAERAIEDLYTEAFARWAPEVTPKVLPALGITAAAEPEPTPPPQQQELPPDPTAVTSTTSSTSWMTVAEVVIIAGIALLWAAAVVEAMRALSIPLPDLPEPDRSVPPPDPRVLRIVNRAVPDMTADDIIRADRIVAATPVLAAAREQVLAEQRAEAQKTPAVVQAKVESAVDTATALSEPSLDVPDTGDSRGAPPAPRPPAAAVQRAAAADALDPEGTALQDISRGKGYQAAGVLNQAVVTAAAQQNADIGEDLQKAWIATLDGKTRPTHWAADGQRVALTAKFKVGAAELEFPGDPTGPPAEIKGCRCRVGILAADEPLPDEVDRHTERLSGRDSTAVNRGGRTQAEEIARRRAAGNVRARDTTDGVGRVAAVNEETDMTDLVDLDLSKCSTVDEAVTAYESADLDPDFAAELTALVAASAVAEPRLRTYDPRLFEDPKLTRPTAPSMNNETGRIYGHLAEWGHTIRGGRDVTPRNRNGYLNFHTGQVQLENGKQLSVGRLTVQGGHASTEPGVTVAAVRAHYDDVSKAFGLVRVGEDQFGIWFSGVPYPGVDPEVFQQGMVTQLSGDWRDCDGYPLDMVAAHAVNTQGFPIYSALTGPDGREMALVASLGPVRRSGAAKVLVVDDVRAIVAEEMAGERERAALAARRDAALTAAHAVVGDPPTPAEQVEELLMRAELVAAIGPGSQMPAQFKKYWLGGAGAAAIGWGKPGDFDRCRKLINAKIVENGQKPLPDHEISGLCASLHHEATGARPGHAPGEGGGH